MTEVSPDMQALISQYEKNEVKSSAELLRKYARKAAAVAPPRVPPMRGKRVFAGSVPVGDRSAWLRALRQVGAYESTDRYRADLFVQEDLQAISQRTRWCCMLGGHSVCTISYIKTQGREGGLVTYKAATSIKRFVWISDGFKAAHTELYPIILAKFSADGSKWTTVLTRQQFIEKARKSRTAGHPCEVMGFVAVAEKTEPDWEWKDKHANTDKAMEVM